MSELSAAMGDLDIGLNDLDAVVGGAGTLKTDVEAGKGSIAKFWISA